MSPSRGRKRPVSEPTPKKKKQASKLNASASVEAHKAQTKPEPAPLKAPEKAKPIAQPKAAITKPKMHPAAIKRRADKLKAKEKVKPSPPIGGKQMEVPLVAREIPRDTYTLVYAGSFIRLDSKKVRRKMQRGETVDLTPAQYTACGSVLGRALVKGDLSMEEVHALLTASKGQVPATAGFGQAPLEAIDFASALPVKDQESQATSVSLSLPNFVPMSTDDIKAWAGLPAVRAWLGDLPDGKKYELVAAIKDRAAEVEADGKPATPEGAFKDL